MRITNLKKSAFSLLEILLAAIIFIISVGGIFATLNAVRQPALQKERALTAAIFGQQLLESLHSSVSANNFDAGGNVNGALSLGTHSLPLVTDPQNVVYNMTYVVTCADGGVTCDQDDTPRQVILNITFNDAT